MQKIKFLNKEYILTIIKHDFSKKFYLYFLVGLVGIIVDNIFTYSSYNFIFQNLFHPTSLLSQHVFQTLSAIFGSIMGMLHNFLISDHFIFNEVKHTKLQTRHSFHKRLLKFYVTGILGSFIVSKIIIFNIALLICHNQILANMIGIAVGLLFNYPINYFWTWKKALPHKNETF